MCSGPRCACSHACGGAGRACLAPGPVRRDGWRRRWGAWSAMPARSATMWRCPPAGHARGPGQRQPPCTAGQGARPGHHPPRPAGWRARPRRGAPRPNSHQYPCPYPRPPRKRGDTPCFHPRHGATGRDCPRPGPRPGPIPCIPPPRHCLRAPRPHGRPPPQAACPRALPPCRGPDGSRPVPTAPTRPFPRHEAGQARWRASSYHGEVAQPRSSRPSWRAPARPSPVSPAWGAGRMV